MVSCGTPDDHFKIEGKFLNLNQGEFYIYSPEGIVDGIDTIKVEGGKFVYEIPCERKSVLMIVFPNYSEQPVFAEPGKSVSIKGDASHLKEMEISGTETNELMSDFRKMVLNSAPPEAAKHARQFIEDNPGSIVGEYIVSRYFIQTDNPDYALAEKLIDIMIEKQEENGTLKRLKQKVNQLKNSALNAPTPSFTAVDVNGKRVTQADLGNRLAVINVWTSWSYESMEIQRTLKQLRRSMGDRLKVISICLDASKKECLRTMSHDSVSWSNICDEQMFGSPLINKIGIPSVPYNIVINNGRIIARGLTADELKQKLGKL